MSTGIIKFYTGPVCAGKTSHMCTDIERYALARKRCVIVKHSIDTRYDHLEQGVPSIITHRKVTYNAVKIYRADKLSDLFMPNATTDSNDKIIIDNIDVIGIDEATFFEDAPKVCHMLALAGKIVICSGIDLDFCGRPIGSFQELAAVADYVEKLKAICLECGADATHSKRLTTSTDLIEIGGTDKYRPVCRRCMYVGSSFIENSS